jgi:hypothetical protein
MALKEFAVVGMTFKFVNTAHSGDIAVTGISSIKVKAGNQFVYQNNLSITITNGSDGSITNATGSGTMTATSTKNLVENVAPLRKGDQSIVITMTGTNPSPPPPTAQYTTQVEIDDPGQTKVKGE